MIWHCCYHTKTFEVCGPRIYQTENKSSPLYHFNTTPNHIGPSSIYTKKHLRTNNALHKGPSCSLVLLFTNSNVPCHPQAKNQIMRNQYRITHHHFPLDILASFLSVTNLKLSEAFATRIKIFDLQKVCLIVSSKACDLLIFLWVRATNILIFWFSQFEGHLGPLIGSQKGCLIQFTRDSDLYLVYS